ncbi:MAG: protein phosphatase, partial [Micromonosporaceae bacterium]|nr:protein phosphatase [Micromonosporaceae bacterium]
MTLTLRYAARSDRGLRRDGNQDSVYAGPRLLAVADGMGGMAAGDIASNIVIGALASLDEDVTGGDLIDRLRQAVSTANDQLRETVEANRQMEGMGTTLTAMLFSGSKAALVNVGDSRTYLLRDGRLSQVTKDDTYVQMLVDEGRITPEEAGSHPQRSLLTRALDGRDVDPEYSVREARSGDRYLLCSDGLSGVVSQETIAETLTEFEDPDQCVQRLIQLALRGGGPDNVTVIIADITDEDIIESQPIVGGAAARDRGMATAADPASPAARAALAARPPDQQENLNQAYEEDDDEEPEARGPSKRTGLVLLATSVLVLGLLAAGGFYGWQTAYYVGSTDDGHIAVFHGFRGEVAGMRLSSEERRSNGITLEDLARPTRTRVERGIVADDRSEAYQIFSNITEEEPDNANLLPPCDPSDSPSPPATTAPENSKGPSPAPGPKQSKTTGPGGTSPSPGPAPSPTPEPTESPTDIQTPGET